VAHYVATRTIAAPIESVFAYRLDLRNLPAYNPNVRDLRSLRGEPAQEGSAYAFRLRLAPGAWTRAELSIGLAERPSRLEFLISSLMNAREVCAFEPTEMDGRAATRVSFDYTVQTRGGFLAPLLDAVFVNPVMRRQVEREMELMAAQLETEPDLRARTSTSGR
jgi:hypothetical protein